MDKVHFDIFHIFSSAVNWPRIFENDRAVICAISGGPDSVTLLDLLDRLRSEMDFTLCAAHFNHGIRGVESDKDEEFVRALCAERKIPLEVGKGDVRLLTEKSDSSLEMEARAARYNFFAEVSRKLSCENIALGHNANDRIENFFMRILRGSGHRGLGSLMHVRSFGCMTLTRPLLDIFRDQIIEYLDERGLTYRVDATNLAPETERGKIRNVVLPGFVKSVEDAGWANPLRLILRSISVFSQEEELIQTITAGYSGLLAFDEEGNIHIPSSQIRDLAYPLIARIIINAIAIIDPQSRPERFHIDRIVEMIRSSDPTGIDLPDGIRAESTGECVIIRHPASTASLSTPNSIKIDLLSLPGRFSFGQFLLTINSVKSEFCRTQTGVKPSHDRIKISLPQNCIAITVRSVEPGDRITPLGMNGHSRKLSDIFIDRKIPQRFRRLQPVVVREPDGSILALPTLGIISELAKIAPESGTILEISTSLDPCQ